ncbi:MAG: hypothetical protein K6F86_07155 [Lachnospiraceae bacterium]|nr:hypothetical protein [Lachnospiraceae bacterium]
MEDNTEEKTEEKTEKSEEIIEEMIGEREEEKRPSDGKFYRGLLTAFIIGVIMILGALVYLWFLLKDYEMCLADNMVSAISEKYSGDDIYYYEDSQRGSDLKRYHVQDGNKRLATVILEPEGERTAFDHQRYRVVSIQNEKYHENDVMQIVAEIPEEPVEEEPAPEENSVSSDSVSGDRAEETEEEVSLPVTPEEEEAVTQLAKSYVNVYAPFSTIKEIGDLRSKVLSHIKKDTNLYTRLQSYSNNWGQNVSSYDFGETVVTNIKKTGEHTYSCDVASVFITNSADWGVKRSYDLTYIMEMEETDGKLLLTSVE